MHNRNSMRRTPQRRLYKQALLLASCLTAWIAQPSYAQNTGEFSANQYGAIGLNTIPSARMQPSGTLTMGVSTLDPYLNSYIGLQIAEPLSITLRQSAELSKLNDDADRLYPGLDLKIRLLEENRSRPEIAIGLQSALGHKRMAGEYIALSKRYKDFDFTLGAGWGRFGTAGHIDNPLKSISTHFSKNRSLDGELANTPDDWFTGEQIGFFGGVEYFTPITGLSVKLDYGADRYEAEKAAFNYETPAPWSLGVNYKPYDGVDMSLGIQGTEKIMGRLSFSTMPKLWPLGHSKYEAPTSIRTFRTDNGSPDAMALAAQSDGIILHNVQNTSHSAHAHLPITYLQSTPQQLGRAYRHMADHGGLTTEELEIIPTVHNLQGPAIRIMRSDIENAIIHKQGSPEEIWHNAKFETENLRENKTQPYRWSNGLYHEFLPELTLENHASISEEDSGTLYRSSILAGTKHSGFFGLITSGISFRLNLDDNLDKIGKLRLPKLIPVRSNVDEFTEDRISLETLYATYTHSFNPSTHIALTNGFVEEMYAGFGGEVLYRPFLAKWALGAEAWIASKRDPDTLLNTGFTGDTVLTGHINGWYDLPEYGLTLNGKVGRYLGTDLGGTIGLTKRFKNGAKLNSFFTLTNQADTDIFGGTTHAYGGMNLSFPLGKVKYVPKGSKTTVKFAPFGRDTGQTLQNPMPLYELTEPLSYHHMIENWGDVVE